MGDRKRLVGFPEHGFENSQSPYKNSERTPNSEPPRTRYRLQLGVALPPMIVSAAYLLAWLQVKIEDLPPEVVDRLPQQTLDQIQEGVLDKLPTDVVDALPDDLADKIPDSLLAAVERNPMFAVLGGLAVIGLIWGIVKSVLKFAVGMAILAAIFWYLYLRG